MPQRRPSDFSGAVQSGLAMVGVLFLVKAVELGLGVPLRNLGIVPRTGQGLPGVLLAPLLHANMSHLLANAAPLFVLLLLLLSDRSYHPWRTLAIIWAGSGLGTWLVGRGGAIHIGASSVVFGLAAFLIVAGFKLGSWRSAGTALFVLVFYGGLFYGALPHAGPVSWEGHLCGAVVGAWTANNLRA
jgi:membrane associated rhomboid family serine protease